MSTAPGPAPDTPTPRRDTSLLPDALTLAAVITTLDDIGVLAMLADEALTVDDVVHRSGLDRRLLGSALDCIVASGIARQLNGRYEVDASTLAYVSRSRDLWAGLGDALRTGRHAARADTIQGASGAYASIVPYLASRFGSSAPALAGAIDAPASARVLDAGAGTAAWTLPFARADPSCRVVAVDLEPVLEVTARHVRDAGAAEQYELIAADLHGLDLDREFDVVVVAAVLHLYEPSVCAALVERLARHLAPGGRLAVVDTIVPAGEPPDASVALYSMSLTLRTQHGGLFSFAACASWMRSAGLSSIRQVALPSPLTAVTGRLRP